MATNYYNVEMGVVDSSGNVNVIYPVTTAANVAVASGETLASRLSTINSNISSLGAQIGTNTNKLNNLLDITSHLSVNYASGLTPRVITISWKSGYSISTDLGSYGIFWFAITSNASSSTTASSILFPYSKANGGYYANNCLNNTVYATFNSISISTTSLTVKLTGSNGTTMSVSHALVIKV